MAGLGFLYSITASTDVAIFSEAITDLEAELARTEAEVSAGVLSPEAAATAQRRIAVQLEIIARSSTKATIAQLPVEQQEQLRLSLDTLTRLLVVYRDTLQFIDEQASVLPLLERTDAGVVQPGVRLLALATAADVYEQLAVVADLVAPHTTASRSELPLADIGATEIATVETVSSTEAEVVVAATTTAGVETAVP